MLKIKKNEFFFYLIWAIYLSSYTLCILSELSYMYDVSGIYSAIRNFVLVAFTILACNNSYKIYYISILLFVIAITIVSLFSAHAVSFLMIIVVGLSIRNNSLDRFLKFDIHLRILLLIIVLLMCFLGVIDNYTTMTSAGLTRMALGFVHPNTLGIFIGSIVVEWLYLNLEKQNIKKFLIIFIITLLLSIIRTSKTVRILLVLILFCCMLFNSKRIQKHVVNSKLLRRFLILFPGSICILCFTSAILYTKSNVFWVTLDTFFTTRIHFAHKYLSTYGISLFETDINPLICRNADLISEVYSNSFDMSYVRIGVEFGLIANLYFVVLGVTENALYNICINPFLVCIVYIILGNIQSFSFSNKKGF